MAITKERLKEIEKLSNEFFVSKNGATQVVANNLFSFYMLAKVLFENLSYLEDSLIEDINALKFTKKTPLENIELVNSFYEYYGIDFDVISLIENGTINFIYNEEDNQLNGRNYYGPNGEKFIDLFNNGVISDSITLVHELSHIKNQTDGGRSLAGSLLSETLAYAEEFIFLDYLYNIGYKEDVINFEKHLFYLILDFSKKMMAVYKAGILFDNLGNLSKESYKLYFKEDDNYAAEMDLIDEYLKDGYTPGKSSEYIMGYCLGLFLFSKFKSDGTVIRNIIELHEKINIYVMSCCLNEFGVGDLSDKDIDRVDSELKLVLSNL